MTDQPATVTLPKAPEQVDTSIIENIPPPSSIDEPIVETPTNSNVENVSPTELPSQPPPLTIEERREKRKILMKVKSYYNAKSSILGKYVASDWEECDDLEELREGLQDIRDQLSIRNAKTIVTGTYYSTIQMAEVLGPRVGLKLNGLSMAIKSKSAEIDDILTEIGIEYADYLQQDPLTRLLMTTAMTAFMVHRINSQSSMPSSNIPVPDSIQEKFRDV